MPNTSLTAAGTREELRRLAGDGAYERGERYASDGRVGDIAHDGGHLTASVTGDRRYRASLWIRGSKVAYDCTCPVGAEGACCKHCVALGLRWLEQGTRRGSAPNTAAQGVPGKKRVSDKRRAVARPLTMKDVREFLATMPTASLVEHPMRVCARFSRGNTNDKSASPKRWTCCG